MIRICVCITDAGRSAHLGGPVDISYRTFDLHNPEMEKLLRGKEYCSAFVAGAEVKDDPFIQQETGLPQ